MAFSSEPLSLLIWLSASSMHKVGCIASVMRKIEAGLIELYSSGARRQPPDEVQRRRLSATLAGA